VASHGGFFHIPVSQVKQWETAWDFPPEPTRCLFIAQQARVSVDLMLPWSRSVNHGFKSPPG